jgi:hypothetical protein
MTSPHVVIVSWQSEVMPVPSHFVFHEQHYTQANLPNMSIRQTSVEDIAKHAVCCGCWENIHQPTTDTEAS